MSYLKITTRILAKFWRFMKFAGAVLMCSLFTIHAVQADGKHQTKYRNKWSLPGDLLQTSNQISFNQGAEGTWFLMESASLDHNILGYKLLPNYSPVCPADVEADLVGLACWWDTLEPTNPNAAYPHVGINFTDHDVNSKGRGWWPSKTLVLHPQRTRLAIIAWRSPDTQRVNISGTIASLYSSLPCGDGVRWSIEQGTNLLANGDTAQTTANASFALKHVMVEEGEALYIVVDPKGDDSCDSTKVSMIIN